MRERLKTFTAPWAAPIDPEVLLRLLLVGYLYGITSERRLVDEVRMHLAYRWFTRLSFNQEIPDHSTFSKNRHGRFRQSGVFRKVFEGPIVFQFPLFPRNILRDRPEFTDRLIPFLKKLSDRKFAIEIRNRPWLNAEFANLLRDHGIALVLQDRSWMPNPSELDFDPITADWTYIRWLGDRREIEAQTLTWDKAVVDRSAELSSWVDFCYQIMKRGVLTYAYANNHFQGHGPATIAKFLELWAANGFDTLTLPEPTKIQQATLFPPLD